MNIGFKIKLVRELRRMKQEEVAEELGMTQGSYSRLESDKGDIKFSKLEHVASILKVQVEDIVGYKEGVNFLLTNNKHANGVIINQMSQSERKLYENHIDSLKAEIITLKQVLNKTLGKNNTVKKETKKK
jgi:transcriptional regulator with XRE-family HTH domain